MKRLVAIIMLLAAAFTLRAQTSIRVDAPNLVAVSEQFNVTFVIEGEDSPTDFQWSPGDDFQLVWGPQRGSSTSVTIVNGKRSRTSQTTFTYVLMPKKEGKFTLPTATAKVGGKEISSSGASVEVVSAQSGGGSQGSSGASGGSAQESGTPVSCTTGASLKSNVNPHPSSVSCCSCRAESSSAVSRTRTGVSKV